MSDLREKNELRRVKIREELAKLKAFKAKCKKKLTVAKLKTMKGFEHLTDEIAKQTIEQLEEYARIIIQQMNRLSKLGINVNEIKK